MNISIIGAGNVGKALAQSWQAAGHTLVFGVKQPSDPKHQGLPVDTVISAIEQAEVVVLATPWQATQELVESHQQALAGKILVDATNPLMGDLSGLSVPSDTSAGELVATWAPRAKVVKAFNTTGFNIMAEPLVKGTATFMPVAGDDADAKATVLALAKDLGFDAVDYGPLAGARQLEHFALVWISLAYRQGLGRDFGFALLRK